MAARSSALRLTSAKSGRASRRLLHQAAVALLAQRLHPRHAHFSGKRPHRLGKLRPADEERGLGVAQEIADLARRVGGVERQVDGTRPCGRKVEHERLGTLLHLHRHPVPRLHAQIDQDIGEPA